MRWFSTLFVAICGCLATVSSQDTCERPSVGRLAGEIILGLNFPFHSESEDGSGCSSDIFDLETIQLLEAANFAAEQLSNAIVGVTIGIEARDTCYSPTVSWQRTFDYVSEMVDMLDVEGNMCPATTLRPGVIATEPTFTYVPGEEPSSATSRLYGTTVSVISTMQDVFMPTVTTGMRPQLNMQNTMQLLKKLGWTYIAIVANSNVAPMKDQIEAELDLHDVCVARFLQVESGQTDYTQLLIDLTPTELKGVLVLLDDAEQNNLFKAIEDVGSTQLKDLEWIIPTIGLVHSFKSYSDVTRGALGIGQRSPEVEEFKMYFQGLTPDTHDNVSNPWFSEYWQTKYSCNLDGGSVYAEDCSETQNSQQANVALTRGVAEVMNSVRALVVALTQAHIDLCGSPGMCYALANIEHTGIASYLKNVHFTGYGNMVISFDQDGFLENADVVVLNYKEDGNSGYHLADLGPVVNLNTNLVSFWENGLLQTGTNVKSVCTVPCTDIQCKVKKQFASITGHIIIGGMFSVHDNSSTPNTCGDISFDGVKRLEAMMYAVDNINNDPNILPGITLGVIGMDSCNNDATVGRKIVELLGSADFSRGVGGKRTGELDETQYIMGVVGTTINELTGVMDGVVSAVMLPQISYNIPPALPTSMKRLPNTFSTGAPIHYQAKAMVDMAVALEWWYIQVIYSDTPIGHEGFVAIKIFAKEVGICIANSLVIKDGHSDNEMNVIINAIRSRTDAKGLLAFTSNTDSRQLVGKLSDNKLEKNFTLVVPQDFHEAFMGFPDVAAGTLMVVPYDPLIPDFQNYFKSLKPDSNRRNPWFREYWMKRFQCYLPGEYSTETTACEVNQELLASDGDADNIADIMDSVTAIARGIDELYGEKCPPKTEMCNALVMSTPDELLEKIRSVTFESAASMKTFEFDDNGDGVPLYNIYNSQLIGDTDVLNNVLVGSWSKDNLTFGYTEPVTLYGPGGVIIYPDQSMPTQCVGACSECKDSSIMYSHVDGDIHIPVMFGISNADDNPLLCGDVSVDQVVNVEAILYALDQVNNNEDILPNIKLGTTILDTCSSPLRASTEAMLTLSGAQDFGIGRPGDIMATIGALISDVSMEMLRITGPLQKTQVSFGSTSYELEDREKYPNFLRTVPSDDRQADVMVSLLMKHGWIYVSTVKSDTVYGNSGMEAFIKKANDAGICVSIELTIPVAATSGNYLSVMTDLLTMGGDKGSNVVVLFTNHHDTRELMKTAKTSARPMPDQPYHLTWVAPDAWGIYSDVVAGLLDETKGAFTIIPLQVPLPLFETYFRSLTPSDNSRNPWFNYLWESIFECSTGTCDGQESLTDVEDSRLHSALSSFAINAVYATAAGLHRLLVNKCPDLKLCQNFFESTPLEVFVAIEEVNIEEAAGGRPFSFAREAGEGGYTIMNYVVDEKEMAGNYRWVGEWIDNELVINDSLVQYYDFSGDRQPYIRSRCPKFCTECYKQGVSPLVVPDSPPLEFYGDTIWAVIILAVCAIGMLFCFVIFIYFLIEFRHPVVKGASSSLSYFLLLGITLLFILNLAFMLSPTISVCGAQRFGLSFFHAIIWSALLCKIIRILRVCGKGEINTKIAFVSPWSQTFLMLALLTVQLVITGEWLILDPPAVEHEIRETNTKPPYELVWMCSYDNKWLVTSLVYVFILLLVTLWCAVPARKYSELLHEGAYILSCCIVSIFIMLAWILIYMLADEEYQHPALCVGITTNAFVILALMFMPKINALTTPRAKDEDDGTTGNDMGKSYVYSNPDVNKDDEVTAF